MIRPNNISMTPFNPQYDGYRIQEQTMKVLDQAQHEALITGDIDTYTSKVPEASLNMALGQALNLNEANWRAFISQPLTSNEYNRRTGQNLTKIENELAKSK